MPKPVPYPYAHKRSSQSRPRFASSPRKEVPLLQTLLTCLSLPACTLFAPLKSHSVPLKYREMTNTYHICLTYASTDDQRRTFPSGNSLSPEHDHDMTTLCLRTIIVLLTQLKFISDLLGGFPEKSELWNWVYIAIPPHLPLAFRRRPNLPAV